MITNSILRINWICLLCPHFMNYFEFPQQALLFMGFLEMIRRGIWNFFVIEKEHVTNCGIFKKIEEIDLPFEQLVLSPLLEPSSKGGKMECAEIASSDLESPFMNENGSGSKRKKYQKCKSVVEMDNELKKKIKVSAKDIDDLIKEAIEFCEFLKITMDMKFKVVDSDNHPKTLKNVRSSMKSVNFMSD